MNSSITAREPPKDHSLSPHKEELKWTQLPPTKILKRPIPRFMTVEQLCAPVPNEMGKDASEVERTMKTLPTIPSEQKMEPAQIGNNLAKGELSDDSVVKTNKSKSFISKNKNKYSPLKTAIHSQECKFKYKAASALSHPNHRNIDLTNTSKTYIDLTNTSKTQQVGTSIHDHHATSCKNGKIASESRKHKTEFCKESFGEDLEHLCTGIDIESIEDFSDDECPGINDKHSTPVLAERVPKRAPHTIETNRLNTKCFKNNRGKLKGKHSIRDGDKPRNLTQLPISGHSTYRSSQSESTNCSMKRTLTFQQNARFTHTVSSSTCTDKKVATRKRPQAAETSTRTKQPRLAMDSGSMAGKRAHTDTEGKTALQATTQCHGSSQSTAACPTPSGAAGSTASSGNGAVLSPRLSTERCPMCNTCFPAWYRKLTHIIMNYC